MNKLLKISLIGIVSLLILIWLSFNLIEILLYVGILFGCVGIFWIIEKVVSYYGKENEQ